MIITMYADRLNLIDLPEIGSSSHKCCSAWSPFIGCQLNCDISSNIGFNFDRGEALLISLSTSEFTRTSHLSLSRAAEKPCLPGTSDVFYGKTSSSICRSFTLPSMYQQPPLFRLASSVSWC